MTAITATNNEVIYIDSAYQQTLPPASHNTENATEAKTERAWLSWALGAASAAGTFAFSYIDFYLSTKIQMVASQTLGICLGNFISKSGLKKFSKIIVPLIQTNNKIAQFLGNNPITESMLSGALEEIEFRWLIQGVLLRNVPAKILKTISPGLEKWVDSLPAKISRVAAVSLLFGYAHLSVLNCDKGGAISPLIGGLLYGTLYETIESPLVQCINMHILYNLYCEFA